MTTPTVVQELEAEIAKNDKLESELSKERVARFQAEGKITATAKPTAGIREQYNAISDPVARARFRKLYAKQLGLTR